MCSFLIPMLSKPQISDLETERLTHFSFCALNAKYYFKVLLSLLHILKKSQNLSRSVFVGNKTIYVSLIVAEFT